MCHIDIELDKARRRVQELEELQRTRDIIQRGESFLMLSNDFTEDKM